jgi:citrate synthase
MTRAIGQEYIPGLAGVPVTKSTISDIDGQKGILKFRGYAIQELAEKSSYEETAYLVLKGELPTRDQLERFSSELASCRSVEPTIIEMIKAFQRQRIRCPPGRPVSPRWVFLAK